MAAGPVIRFVSGKGGVGKTLAATAVALAEVRAGARVLVVEINGRDSVPALLGVEPSGYKTREIFNFWHVDANPWDAIREYALLTLRVEALYKAVFENRLVRHFIRLVPSLPKLVMLPLMRGPFSAGKCSWGDLIGSGGPVQPLPSALSGRKCGKNYSRKGVSIGTDLG